MEEEENGSEEWVKMVGDLQTGGLSVMTIRCNLDMAKGYRYIAVTDITKATVEQKLIKEKKKKN